MSDKDTELTEENETQASENSPETLEAEAEQAVDDDMATKLAEAEAKAQENWDQLLRTKAEMDNLRRRTERDLENAHKFALEKIAQELLAVRDSLEMGLTAAQADNAEVSSLVEGTDLTLKMLVSVMDKFAIKEVNPLDEAFNPEHHQAISMLEAPDKVPNTVINVMQKGYTLNDRLIRPAMVVVSKAGSEPTVDENGSNIDEQA